MKHTPRNIIITLPKIKQKESNLKTAREKETVTYKRVSIRLSACLLYTSDAADEHRDV